MKVKVSLQYLLHRDENNWTRISGRPVSFQCSKSTSQRTDTSRTSVFDPDKRIYNENEVWDCSQRLAETMPWPRLMTMIHDVDPVRIPKGK